MSTQFKKNKVFPTLFSSLIDSDYVWIWLCFEQNYLNLYLITLPEKHTCVHTQTFILLEGYYIVKLQMLPLFSISKPKIIWIFLNLQKLYNTIVYICFPVSGGQFNSRFELHVWPYLGSMRLWFEYLNNCYDSISDYHYLFYIFQKSPYHLKVDYSLHIQKPVTLLFVKTTTIHLISNLNPLLREKWNAHHGS